MNIVKKIWNLRHFLLWLPTSIYFNLRYFPCKQAWRLPVWLCNPKISGSGKYSISGPVRCGMIRLGFPMVSVFREKGVILENRGEVVFEGNTVMGGGAAVSVGKSGRLTFGHRFANQSGAKIICYHRVTFKEKVRVGWHTVICDTDFHTMKSEDGSRHTQGYGPITIGDNVWVGSFCKIFKNTEIPSHCTLAANTFISRKMECRPYSLIYSGDGVKAKYTGFCRELDDDTIQYNEP